MPNDFKCPTLVLLMSTGGMEGAKHGQEFNFYSPQRFFADPESIINTK